MPTADEKNKQIHEIHNEFLKVGVLSRGAELCSIRNLENNKEYIWQANPEIWPSHAPNLFPVIGILKEGAFIYEEREYQMPKHGLIRYNNNIHLKDRSEKDLVFQLMYSEETLEKYPFKFSFEISFTLEGKKLKVSNRVTNLDSKPLYFSLGSHPAFNVPLWEGESYEDHYLEFNKNQELRTHLLNDDGLISGETNLIAENSNKIELHKHLFDNDALVFKEIESKEVALKSKISGTILTVEYSDFRNLGIWAKPGAPYVCIEPWLGIADVAGTDRNIKTKEGIMELMPSQDFFASYTITIA